MALVGLDFYIGNTARFIGIAGGRDGKVYSDAHFGKLFDALVIQIAVAAMLYSQGLLIDLGL